jgi:hypothetical protein
MNREQIKKTLQESIAVVTFTKVNGDERVMQCTLNEAHLPPANKDDPMSQKKVREINEEVLSVWDTKAEGWRSFRIENVTSVDVIDWIKK